jgi:quercetin dioxygenase-like cupin family protein
MESVLKSAVRKFISKAHIRNVLEGEWVEMVNEEGETLQGIRGRVGTVALTAEETEIGADAIEMQPGSAFPLHVHPGDHILYIIQGGGLVHVDGVDYKVRKGDTIFIPAEYPHSVKTFDTAPSPLTFLAVGHPHKHISAKDRMRLVKGHPDNE